MTRLILLLLCVCSGYISFAQTEKPLLVVDDIQIDIKNIYLSSLGDTAVVEMYLISYQKNPRELKINTFASGIMDSNGKTFLYTSMLIGRILVSVDTRQNYIHYLLEQDVPVRFLVKTANWNKQWGMPKQFKLAFEDSTEEGKFLEVDVNL